MPTGPRVRSHTYVHPCATDASRLTTLCPRVHDACLKGSMDTRASRPFPDAAILCCQAGTTALKGNLHDSAAESYREALVLNPLIWEAFEGLCAIGAS